MLASEIHLAKEMGNMVIKMIQEGKSRSGIKQAVLRFKIFPAANAGAGRSRKSGLEELSK